MTDEQMLVIRTPKGLAIIAGCAHAGILNCMEYVKKNFPGEKLYLLLAGMHVRYMLWRDEIVRIKQGGEELQGLLEELKNVQVLYIDDLFKSGDLRPTAADINYAFEILNYRYNNPKLLTILSSELTEDELLDVDEAVGGRIYERARAFTVGRSRDKNYRLRKAVRL